MCTFQVFAQNNTHTDSVKDARGCWKRGYIVDIYDDGVCVEPPSAGSKSVFIHVPGLGKSAVAKYMGRWQEKVGDTVTKDARRLFQIMLPDLPAAVKKKLADNREVTIPQAKFTAQIKKYVKNLNTGAFEA